MLQSNELLKRGSLRTSQSRRRYVRRLRPDAATAAAAVVCRHRSHCATPPRPFAAAGNALWLAHTVRVNVKKEGGVNVVYKSKVRDVDALATKHETREKSIPLLTVLSAWRTKRAFRVAATPGVRLPRPLPPPPSPWPLPVLTTLPPFPPSPFPLPRTPRIVGNAPAACVCA
jgi:hypothetical protein